MYAYTDGMNAKPPGQAASAARQIRIFVPPETDATWWAENVMGHVIKPIVEKFNPAWFWFSRYEEYAEGSANDTDLTQIPGSFCKDGLYRSVRFRMHSTPETQCALEPATLALIADAGFRAAGFLDYDYIYDLASGRFLGEPRTAERLQRRADLHARFLDATSRVYLDALLGPDENNCFVPEPNSTYGSSFAAMRHLFCNMTNAPTPVWVDENENVLPNPSGEVVILVKPGRVLKKVE